MKKLLTILLLFSAFFVKAQSPIQTLGVAGGQIHMLGQLKPDSVFFVPQYADTLFSPGGSGAFIYRRVDNNLYYYNGTKWTILTGITWGTIPGTLTNQTDLYDSLLNRQYNLVNGKYTIANLYSVDLDTSKARIIDSIYRIIGKDSIYYHRINGTVSQILDSAGGGGGSGTIVGARSFPPLFTTGIASADTITFTAINQNSNLVYAGPTLGSAAAPTFRALVIADLPTGIPTANLANSNINFAIGSSGSSPNWSVSSINLGGTAVLNLPTASASITGILASADWTTFNNKVTSVNGITGVVVTKNADSIKHLPVDTTTDRNAYVLTFDSTNHKWYLAPGGGGGGTTYSIGTIDGNGASANGLSISGSSIFAQSASATNPGMVNVSTQTFAGNKTFNGSITLTGITAKVPISTDSALIRDASGKLWVYPVAAFVKYTDTSAMLAGYLQSVTSLSPLFTTAISSHVATFTLSTATAHKFFGNFTGSTAAPSYSSPALASADFLNQGTTTTVLHGNAAGNPSWGSVALATDVSGLLPIANGGTGTASPGETAGIGIKITGSFPTQAIAVDTANFKDTVFARNIGTTVGADSLMYIIGSTTIGIRKIMFRSNLTVSHNADSTLVIDVTSSGGSGVTSVGGFDAQSASTNGLVIVGTSIYAQSASATAPGMVNTVSQTFAGAKTFSSAPTFTTLTTNGGPYYGDGSGVMHQSGNGTAVQVLHGGTAPSFSSIALTTDVSGILPLANGGNGTATPSISNGTGITLTGTWGAYTISAINLGTVTSVNVSGGATGLSFAGGPITSSGTVTMSGTLIPANGGTGLSSLTPYAVLAGGSTATGTLQQVSGLGTAGQVLTSNGAGLLPSWQAGGGGITSPNSTITVGGSTTIDVTHPNTRPTSTVSSPTSFSFVAGDYIEAIWVDPTSTTVNFQVGSTTGTGTGSDYDLIPTQNLATGSLNNFVINKRITGSVTYYFQNISSSTVITVLKQQ